MVGISVIVIACPCALALATPIATLVGISMGAKKGVLFKEAAFLETMAKANKVFFDKTGTLTDGALNVVNKHEFEPIEDEKIAKLLFASIHPVAKAVYQELGIDVKQTDFTSYELMAGKGMVAKTQEHTYHGGSRIYLESLGMDLPELATDKTQFFIAKDKQLARVYDLEDQVKAESKVLIDYLHQRGIQTYMLTGDHERSAQRVANQLGMDKVHASLTPQKKADLIKENREAGDVTVMVGDGINDIVVLATADIGIAMGKGADVTIDSSDVVLLHDDMKSLKDAFAISQRSYQLIRQNLQISLVYNVITIPLAMAGMIIPLIAALSMSLSSLLVVGNSLRVKALKF
jgi:Cu+-exporting ATPase